MTEPTTTTTDWRALCARMADELDHYRQLLMDDRRATHALAAEARAALEAQPEPQGPTDEELETTARAAEIQYVKEHGGLAGLTLDGLYAQLQAQRLAGLRAVAARWGRPAIEPVPVSERLPGDDECRLNPRTGTGHWCWDLFSTIPTVSQADGE